MAPDYGMYSSLIGTTHGNHLLEIPFVWQGGMAIQGGVVLGTIAAIGTYCKNNIDFWAFAGFIPAPALILAQSVVA